MNVEVDESSEERKGGAGNLAKMLLTAGKDTLLILTHVPAALAAEKGLGAKEWAEVVIKPVEGSILSEEGDVVIAEVKGDPEKVGSGDGERERESGCVMLHMCITLR